MYLCSLVEAADVLSDALASDDRMAHHVHEVSESKDHLNIDRRLFPHGRNEKHKVHPTHHQ